MKQRKQGSMDDSSTAHAIEKAQCVRAGRCIGRSNANMGAFYRCQKVIAHWVRQLTPQGPQGQLEHLWCCDACGNECANGERALPSPCWRARWHRCSRPVVAS